MKWFQELTQFYANIFVQVWQRIVSNSIHIASKTRKKYVDAFIATIFSIGSRQCSSYTSWYLLIIIIIVASDYLYNRLRHFWLFSLIDCTGTDISVMSKSIRYAWKWHDWIPSTPIGHNWDQSQLKRIANARSWVLIIFVGVIGCTFQELTLSSEPGMWP